MLNLQKCNAFNNAMAASRRIFLGVKIYVADSNSFFFKIGMVGSISQSRLLDMKFVSNPFSAIKPTSTHHSEKEALKMNECSYCSGFFR